MSRLSAAAAPVAAGVNRAALLTPRGRGAIAVIAAAGPVAATVIDGSFHAANGRSARQQRVDRVACGVWRDGCSGDAAVQPRQEEVILCRCDEDSWEIHCHGGDAAAERILTALAAAGCAVVDWGAWLAAQESDLIIREADLALAAAPTRRTAAHLLAQRQGALRRAVGAVEQRLRAGKIEIACRQVAEIRRFAPLGARLVEPWRVAIAGLPNAGKSSLLNALVGYGRALVAPLPGTTRDLVEAAAAVAGWPVRLVDSAGLRDASCELEAAGVELAQRLLAEADLVLWVVDGTLDDGDLAAASLRAARQQTERTLSLSRPAVTVVSKIDLVDARRLARLDQHERKERDGATHGATVRISSTTGAGLDELLATIAAQLVPAPPAADAAIPFTRRQRDLLDAVAERLAASDPAAALISLGAM